MVWVCPGAEAAVLPLVRDLPLAGDEDALPLTGFGHTFTRTHLRPRRRRTVLHLGLGLAGFFDDLTDPELLATGFAPADATAQARQAQAAIAINVWAIRCALRPRRE
jgi:hypothetical protein